MSEVIYHCIEGASNKRWSYQKVGTNVLVKWGRCGLSGQELLQTFSSDSEANNFIATKVREKVKKGYKQVTEAQLTKEVQLSKELGWQHKITVTKWGRLRKDRCEILLTREYDDTQFVYVEILNSWTKDKIRLLLSKAESFFVEGVAFEDQTISYSSLRTASSNSLVSAVRNYLRRLSEKIVEIVRTKVGVFGRKLVLAGMESEIAAAALPDSLAGPLMQVAIPEQEVFETVGESESSISREAVCQIAMLGCRKLDL